MLCRHDITDYVTQLLNHLCHFAPLASCQQLCFVCSEAASKAVNIGGWPPPELAAIDATIPQQWWQPQALAAFEGALSSMCLPGMPASLGISPQEGKLHCDLVPWSVLACMMNM